MSGTGDWALPMRPRIEIRYLPNYGIADEFPLMWDMAWRFDFAERLGGCSDPLLTEIDAALRELWDARSNLAISSAGVSETGAET